MDESGFFAHVVAADPPSAENELADPRGHGPGGAQYVVRHEIAISTRPVECHANIYIVMVI